MKRSLAIVAFSVATYAPAAYGQVSCDEMRRVMSEAESDFGDIIGAKIENGFYESRYLVGGSRECYVQLTVDATYACLFQHDHPDTAFSAYNYRLGEIRSCLSGWHQVALNEEDPISEGYRVLEGVRFGGSGDNAGFHWLVLVEQHIVNNQAHYHVRVELSYD